jgi:VIT1/CCC1 family predicted Fe2+/Mn2+ transporter
MAATGTGSGRPITDVLVDIGRNAQELLRAELRLAQSEVRERLIEAQPAVGLVVLGVAAALLSGFFLLMGVLFVLRFVMPGWAAALCIALALALTAVIALHVGLRQIRAARPVLKRLEDSDKENAAWAKQPTR